MTSKSSPDFSELVKNEHAWRMWVATEISVMKNDVGWMKKLLTPLTLILAAGAVLELMLRLTGH